MGTQNSSEAHVSSKPPNKIAILGAGVTGLVLAQGLQKNGFEVTIYERDPSIEFRDNRPVSFMIHWGFEVLQSLLPADLWASIQTTFCNHAIDVDHVSDGITFYHGLSGDLLFRSPPMVMRRVTRQGLRRLASKNLDIQWNKTLESFTNTDQGVVLKFTDATTASADMFIGADGPRSQVRVALLGEDKAACTKSDFVCGYTSAVLGKDIGSLVTEAHPIWTMTYHPMGVCAVGLENTFDSDDEAKWAYNVTRIWRGDSPKVEGKAAIDIIKDNTKTFCEPFRTATAGIPDDSPTFVRALTHWRPVPWEVANGRVTIAGDAVHPMLPFRGQGLNHAIDDASKLVAALVSVSKGDVTLVDAVRNYNAEVVERGQMAVDTAVNEGKMVQDMDKLAQMAVATKGVTK